MLVLRQQELVTFQIEISTHYVIALKEWVKECVFYFCFESLGTIGSSDIFRSADEPANEGTSFHVVRSFAATIRRWVIVVWICTFFVNNQTLVLSTCQIVVSKEFWRFFDALRGFHINSTPESNRLFGNNGGCVYPLAFFHKPLRPLHYRRRGNSGFKHADKSIRAIFD